MVHETLNDVALKQNFILLLLHKHNWEKWNCMIRDAVRNRSPHEGLITALAIGGFFIILGSVFAFTPDIVKNSNGFFSDLTTIAFPFGNPGSTMSLLAPAHPAEHQGFYAAVMNFLVGVGILQIVILALRLVLRSPIRRIAQSVGDLIFWLGAAIVANAFLLLGTHNGWFQFWSSLIVIIGLSLIGRFFVYLAKRQ
jgi:predicted small integral membrane protein